MTPDPALAASPRVAEVIARTVRDLPAHTRRAMRVVLLVWIAVVVLQAWDSGSRPGARGLAELVSVVLGTLGFMTIGFAQVLRGAADPPASPRRVLDGPAAPAESAPAAVRQILMSLPLVCSLAAMLLSAAVVVLIARVWLGTEVVILAIAVVYVVAAGVALNLAREASARLYAFGQAEAVRASRIEAQLVEARLAALQAQMHPHFLFNALNTVAALTRSDPRAAETTVEHLAEVLRAALSRSQQTMSTVAEEVGFVRAYLAVESQRFGPRLHVEWDVDPALDTVAVPPYSLQPLVENALKHGVGARAEGGRLRISVRRGVSGIELAVDDDGDGFPQVIRDGTGLSNLRDRLKALYADGAALRIERPAAGARVVVAIPDARPGA